MVDISYGGCRLRFDQEDDVPLTHSLGIPLPTNEAPIQGTPVWRVSALEGHICGVAISGGEESLNAWREFVNGLRWPCVSLTCAVPT